MVETFQRKIFTEGMSHAMGILKPFLRQLQEIADEFLDAAQVVKNQMQNMGCSLCKRRPAIPTLLHAPPTFAHLHKHLHVQEHAHKQQNGGICTCLTAMPSAKGSALDSLTRLPLANDCAMALAPAQHPIIFTG